MERSGAGGTNQRQLEFSDALRFRGLQLILDTTKDNLADGYTFICGLDFELAISFVRDVEGGSHWSHINIFIYLWIR